MVDYISIVLHVKCHARFQCKIKRTYCTMCCYICYICTSVTVGQWVSEYSFLNAKIHYTSFPVASPQHKRQVRSKSATSWCGQKSVVSCRFPNSITTPTSRRGDMFATSWQLPRLRGSYGETCVIDSGHNSTSAHNRPFRGSESRVWNGSLGHQFGSGWVNSKVSV